MSEQNAGPGLVVKVEKVISGSRDGKKAEVIGRLVGSSFKNADSRTFHIKRHNDAWRWKNGQGDKAPLVKVVGM